MKKLGAIFASLAMFLCLTACGNNETQNSSDRGSAPSNSTSSENSSVESSDSESNSKSETSEPTSESKMLVVYFSASGNTKTAAELIAEQTNADLFEIVPKVPYTSDDLNWTNDGSRVNYEHDNPDARDVELESASVENWESYSTVFVGFPIWWGIAAWPTNSFVKANDFTGKTVIPFCTSTSSGLGNSGKLLADEAGTGNWLDGHRFASSPSKSDVSKWLNELEF